ncbi:MAG: cytochrome P450 [Parvibaculaceae bacterium]
MDSKPVPFVPPAPRPRRKPPSALATIGIVYRNAIELWAEPAYNEPWVLFRGLSGPIVIANDPALVRHVLLDNAANYKMAPGRQALLRPLLRDGLITAEGEAWRRSRKAMAPIFTPRHIQGFAPIMLARASKFAKRYETATAPVDIAEDMTELTFDILAETLFSGEIAAQRDLFLKQIARLLETMGRMDPLDLLRAPQWLPRFTHLRGRRSLAFIRKVVADTIALRERSLGTDGRNAPQDFLGLLLGTEQPGGLTRSEIEDNIVTFFGAGHETTARALGWTIYLLAQAPWERERVEAEIDRVTASETQPSQWLDKMPFARAALEEALRLYPPAPFISREPIEDDACRGFALPKGAQVFVMPWTIHRHRKLWDQPDAFLPERFHPGNRDRIDRFQYLPFGAGPRVCIGSSFAMQEAIIVLAVLLSRFRFDATAATKPWPVQRLTTQPRGGLPMRVSRR